MFGALVAPNLSALALLLTLVSMLLVCAALCRGCCGLVMAYSAVMVFLRIKMPNYMAPTRH